MYSRFAAALSTVLLVIAGVGSAPAAEHFAVGGQLAAPVVRPAAVPSLEEVNIARAEEYPGLRSFLDSTPGSWQIQWDLRSDRPHLIQGGGPAVIPADGARAGLEQVASRVRAFLRQRESLLRVQVADLALLPARSGSVADGKVWLLEFEQVHGGVPVDGATVFVRINHGRVVQFGTRALSEIRAHTDPSLSSGEAWEIARERFSGSVVEMRSADLVLVPSLADSDRAGERYSGSRGAGYEHSLAWRIHLRAESPRRSYVIDVDAADGEIVAIEDQARFADDGMALGSVTGGVASNTPGAIVEGTPFGFADVENDGLRMTDAFGSYEYVGGDAVVRLDGPYAEVDDQCGVIQLSNDVDGVLDLGTATATDCGTPGFGGGGNTNSARSAFYYLTNMSRKAATFFPDNPWLDTTLKAYTNEAGPFLCNAYWDGESVNFYRSGGGCANTGELPAVILHEWAHGLELNTGGYADDVGSSEALADTVAFLETGDACIGTGFFVDGESCPNCRSECDGVRDVAAFALGGQSLIARPETIASVDGIDCGRLACPYEKDGFPSQGPMGYESHCESYIGSTANWDLHQSLMDLYGDDGGTAVMEDLWYGSMTAAKSVYQVADGGTCNPAAEVNGCAADNWYTVFLAIDDDDGDLSNGTPNGCRIWDAYNAHGIACGERPRCSADANQAPSVAISEPLTGETYPAGAVITLEATANDFEEGDVTTALEWVSSRDGFLGSGGSVETTLSVGTHVITATASDTEGASSSDVIALFVEGELAYTVTKFDDTDDGSCDVDCSLREAINAANANPGVDSVVLSAGEYLVTRSGNGATGGDLNIEDSLTLIGEGADATVVRADGNQDRVFLVAASDVEISGITIRGGYTVGLNLFATGTGGLGGGIFVAEDAELLLDRSWVTDNNITAATAGNFGGGGLYAAPGAAVTISRSTLSDNVAAGLSTVTEQKGGGLYVDNGASVDVVDSTLSGNVTDVLPPFFDYSDTSAAYVAEGGLLTLSQTTVADNAPVGYDGGLWADLGGTLSLANSIVEGVCAGAIVSLGGNIESPGATCALDQDHDLSSISSDDLALGGLDATVGATPIHLPGESSVAVDQALAEFCGLTDQLDRARDEDGDGDGESYCDVGSIEVAGPTYWSLTFSSIGAEDGSVGELEAGSGVGGDLFDGESAPIVRAGDHPDGRQGKMILSFDLGRLPEGAEVASARLRMHFSQSEGGDLFDSHGAARLDLSSGGFGGDVALQPSDFEAAADAVACGTLQPNAEPDGWAVADIDSAGFELLNASERAQIRIAFELPSDEDRALDFVAYHSGDFADADLHPELVIVYRESNP